MLLITTAELKMFSAICSNFVVVFIAAMPVTRDFDVLLFNLLGTILFWKIGILAEEKLEEL